MRGELDPVRVAGRSCPGHVARTVAAARTNFVPWPTPGLPLVYEVEQRIADLVHRQVLAGGRGVGAEKDGTFGWTGRQPAV